MVFYNRTTHLRAKQIPKELTQKRNAKLFCKTDFSLLSQLNARKEKADGAGGEQEASPPAHGMFRRSVPGFLALDSILHTWYKTKTNLYYPQNSHYIYQGGYLLKNPSRFKWHYIDNPPTPLPKPNTTPKRTEAMGEFIPNHRLDFDCGPQH